MGALEDTRAPDLTAEELAASRAAPGYRWRYSFQRVLEIVVPILPTVSMTLGTLLASLHGLWWAVAIFVLSCAAFAATFAILDWTASKLRVRRE